MGPVPFSNGRVASGSLMIRIPLWSDDTFLLLAPRFGDWTTAAQWTLLAGLLLVPATLVLWLYRYELRLLSRSAAALLLVLRFLVVVLLWFLAGWQPTVARYREEEVPSRVLVAVDLSASMDTQDVQRTAEEKQALVETLGLSKDETAAQALAQVDGMSRAEIVRRFLAEKAFFKQLAARHQVELVGFDRTLWQSAPENWSELFAGRGKSAASAQGTNLQLPLGRAGETAGKNQGKLLGVIVFTDGQHNAGPEATLLDQARQLAKPVYPVAIGAREPPVDLAVLEVKAPPTALKNTDVALEAWVKIAGVPAQELVVELAEAGKPVRPEYRKTIQHDGKLRVVSVPFQWKSEELGTHALQVKVRAPAGTLKEISSDNNQQTALVRIADDKARVLLVDGEARWEYHYLATALARDPHVKLDEVLFTQPRLGTTPQDKLERLGFARLTLPEKKPGAKDEDPLHQYDCIFLGDVPPAKLSLEDRRRLERYVAERGGTLVLMAGKRHFPADYTVDAQAATDPLVKMMPLAPLRPVEAKDGFTLALGAGASLTPLMQLESSADENLRRWQGFPRHYWGMVGKPRPGATVLAYAETPGDAKKTRDTLEKEQAAVLLQPYGFGHVLYVGIESTWRWRYKIGDAYHHRFWGQVVRWAVTDKLLPGGNRYVRFGSKQPVVRPNQPVQIDVRLAEDLTLAAGTTAQVKLWRQLGDGKEEQAALVPLTKNAKQAKLLEAQARDLPAGKYRIEVDIPSLKDKINEPPDTPEQKKTGHDLFTVLPAEEGETFDLAVNWPLLGTLADETRGRLFTLDDAEELIRLLERQVERKTERDEQRFWQDAPLVWWVFAVLLSLLSVEWIVRKWAGLP